MKYENIKLPPSFRESIFNWTYSRARNMKRKLQFLRRRNTDSALGAALMKTESKLSPEQAQQWSRSFDSLLMDKSKCDRWSSSGGMKIYTFVSNFSTT